MLRKLGKLGMLLLGYSSFLWVAGWFQARFHWLLEAVDDALSLSSSWSHLAG